jgi:hypothetical protein
MVKLSELVMFDNLHQMISLPVIISRVLQVKEIAMHTAEKAQFIINE